MSNLYVDIRFYYWHLRLRKGSWMPFIEKNPYWLHYYEFDGAKPKEKILEVYEFFT